MVLINIHPTSYEGRNKKKQKNQDNQNQPKPQIKYS